MKVVVVESPAKAKTINRYLGDDFKVLASYGHVCDLPSKDGSVLPDNDFEMKWQVSTGSEKHLKDIKEKYEQSNGKLFLQYQIRDTLETQQRELFEILNIFAEVYIESNY